MSSLTRVAFMRSYFSVTKCTLEGRTYLNLQHNRGADL